jgi:3-hydroxyacyl-[acyl-carrier-protein] dehydratase
MPSTAKWQKIDRSFFKNILTGRFPETYLSWTMPYVNCIRHCPHRTIERIYHMKMDQEAIRRVIPHRDPMLLVTTVEDMTPGEHITTTFFVDSTREIFKGHFPGDPVLPGVYSVECMAQTADILLLSTPRYAGKTPLFLGINNVRFLKKILPGDTIEIHAELFSERPEKAIATCAAKIYNHGELAASGEVTLAMR